MSEQDETPNGENDLPVPPVVTTVAEQEIKLEDSAGVAPGEADQPALDADAPGEEAVQSKPLHNEHCLMTSSPLTMDPNASKSPLSLSQRVNAGLVNLPGNTDELNALSETYKATDMSRSEEQAAWMEAVKLGYENIPAARAYIESLAREGSLWKQSVDAGAEKLFAGSPKFAEGVEPGDRLTGDRAMMRIQSLLKIGQTIRAPMWHSGIWLTFKAPTESALLELERRISNEKISLGRETSGLVFSNTAIYINSYLVNFALAHVFDSTLRYKEVNELKAFLKVTDIPLMIWGLLSTMYPSGYPHIQPCVKDPSKCSHLMEELISIGKLLWTDERALTERQRRHMTKKTEKFSADDLKFYAEEHQYNNLATLEINEAISVELKVPTILEYEQAGFQWVDDIVRDTDQAFGGTMRGDERNTYIIQQAQTSSMRQYGHYVRRVVMNGTEIIDDPMTIADTLALLTSSAETYKRFFDGVGKFIDNATISLVAIPKFDCPKCGAADSEDVTRTNVHPYLIPLDVIPVFFTLRDQRLFKTLTKSPTQS